MLHRTLALATLLALPHIAQAEPPDSLMRRKCDADRGVETTATVEGAADGDTVYIRTATASYSVRMIGTDTPETHYQGHSQGEWGEVAAARLKEFLPVGTKVRLELSESVCDMYGRVLAHVFVGPKHINKQMVKEGLAVNYCLFPSVAYCEELGELAQASINERRGMFSDPNVELPYDFRRRISGRHPSSFVGSLRSKEVYRPGNQDRVAVGERIFFQSESNVEAPYHVVE